MFTELTAYGFNQSDIMAAQNILENKKQDNLIPGRVIEARRERFTLVCEKGEIHAELKGSFYHNLEEGGLYPVTGDFVLARYNNTGASLIDSVLPRRSEFSRVDFLGHAEGYAKNVREQVLASNFDYVFILSSLNHDLNLNRIARYLTASWQSNGFPVIVLTKADISDDIAAKTANVQKLNREVPVIAVSSKTGSGLSELEPFMEPGKTIVFLGSSGVGKSSLLNRLAGKELMEVKEIREDDSKGRHTTTHRHLFRLSSGAMIIDTPGIRELGLWDAREGLSMAFAEIEELFPMCRFNNCSHKTEPGCAVLAALENQSLSEEQWKLYCAQMKETAFVSDHSAYLKQKHDFQKSIARFSRDRKNKKEVY